MRTLAVVLTFFAVAVLPLNCAKNCSEIQQEVNKLICTTNSVPSVSTQLHMKVTGVATEGMYIDEELLLSLQKQFSRGDIRSCLQMNKGEKYTCPWSSPCPTVDNYSNIDGSCNNLNNRMWGAAGISYLRDLPAVYHDGIQTLRKSVTGADLPNPRTISNVVHSQPAELLSSINTKWVATFGQAMAHDFVKTPVASDFNGKAIDCCNSTSNCASQCLPINVTGDPFYATVGQTCINVVRSVSVPCDLCENVSPCQRNQLNVLSSYIDGSATYGNSVEYLNKLRDGAKLKVGGEETTSNYHCLPGDSSPDACRDGTIQRPCFLAGDARVNVVPGLQGVLTLFMREHNRIVDKLKALNNPGWSEDILFQEARKILIAEMQHFTFKHYMEVVLGPTVAAQYSLDEAVGYDDVYDDSVRADVSNSFGAAAYRFGHSIETSLQGQHKVSDNTELFTDPLSNTFFRCGKTYTHEGPSGISRFLQNRPMGASDAYLTDDMRDKLFMNLATGHGMDLAAINILRGRDHGLASYNSWKTWCQQQPFPTDHSANIANKIRRVYADDADIDLFTGGLSEKPVPGGLVGPLFSCIIGRQLHRMKVGDRFYFQNTPDSVTSKGRFTLDQVLTLQHFTLSRLVCENSDTKNIQKNIFMLPTPDNTVQCDNYSELPDIDFEKWRL